MFCARLFIYALWSPAGKGLTSWLSFVVSSVSLSLSHWYPGSGVVLDCIDSWSLHHYLLLLCYNKCTCINIKLTFVLLNLDISRFWKQLIIKLLSSADNIHEQFGVRSGPTVWLVLIWIHTIWHLDFFPEISWKYLFWKESADDNKITKYVACKDLYKKFNAVWSGTIFLFFEQNNLFTKR